MKANFNRIGMIVGLRKVYPHLGLKEAKDWVETLGSVRVSAEEEIHIGVNLDPGAVSDFIVRGLHLINSGALMVNPNARHGDLARILAHDDHPEMSQTDLILNLIRQNVTVEHELPKVQRELSLALAERDSWKNFSESTAQQNRKLIEERDLLSVSLAAMETSRDFWKSTHDRNADDIKRLKQDVAFECAQRERVEGTLRTERQIHRESVEREKRRTMREVSEQYERELDKHRAYEQHLQDQIKRLEAIIAGQERTIAVKNATVMSLNKLVDDLSDPDIGNLGKVPPVQSYQDWCDNQAVEERDEDIPF